jgi:hypothetical protein
MHPQRLPIHPWFTIRIGVAAHRCDEGAVDLDLVDRQVSQSSEAGISGTEVVERVQAAPPKPS